jgi:hypothetical protein
MVRKKAFKRLKSVLPKVEYAEITGAMWPFRKRPADLKPLEWDLLEHVFTYSPKIEAAYHLREDLTELFERDYAKVGAKCAMRARSGDDRAMDRRNRQQLPRAADARVCGGLQQPREGAQKAVLWDL